jgi:rod shape-determining protein MreC
LARDQDPQDYARQARRLLVGVLIVALLGVFVVWRIDSPRVERLRMAVIDRVVPGVDWALVPVARMVTMLRDFQSYARVYEQNNELRRELQQMKSWREAAIQLEQQNARLLDLNKVRIDPQLTHVTGVVLADSGSPFRQSVLLNVGAHDGIRDGWAVMDGLGLVGRIAGLGTQAARVLLLTDAASRVPVTLQPSDQRAVLAGDNAPFPALDFIEAPDLVRPGDRVVSSGDGGVFPAGLLVGTVVQGTDRRLRVALAADYRRLEFLRVLRSHDAPVVDGAGGLILSPAASPAMTEPTPAPNSVSEDKAAIAAPGAPDLLRAQAQDG